MILFTLLTDKLTTLSQNNETQAVQCTCYQSVSILHFSFSFQEREKEENLRRKHVQLWFSNEKKAKEPMCINHYHYDICGELKQMYLYREYYPEFDEKKPLFIHSP